jgi:hypothetical protein
MNAGLFLAGIHGVFVAKLGSMLRFMPGIRLLATLS